MTTVHVVCHALTLSQHNAHEISLDSSAQSLPVFDTQTITHNVLQKTTDHL